MFIACYCSKNPTAQRCGNTALGVSSYRSFLTGYYLLVLMVWIICIFGRNEKCYLILLRKRIRFSMLFYSIMQFSLFLQPAIPLLINLISVYNKLWYWYTYLHINTYRYFHWRFYNIRPSILLLKFYIYNCLLCILWFHVLKCD